MSGHDDPSARGDARPTRVLHVLIDPPLDGPTNMARDETLLHSTRLRPAVLRIYFWDPPTISLGYFQRYSDLDSLPESLRRLAVVRRPTGGGAILHDQEITYCLVLDGSVPLACKAPVELYRAVHRCWQQVLEPAGVPTRLAPEALPLPSPRSGPFFCFESPGRTDLLLGNRKLAGSAQRRTPSRVLQHGSLLTGKRFDAHPGAHVEPPSQRDQRAWIDAFVRRVAQALALEPRPTSWSDAELREVARRRCQYASDAWTRRR